MARNLPAIISIHDVAPDTLEKVQGLIELIPPVSYDKVLLLVIPGRNWTPEKIQQLLNWQQQGFMLAGHGWHHRAAAIKGWYHRLHSLLISRDAAEHLALDKNEIIKLIDDNYRWFIGQGLKAPEVYVPPAWAMGSIARSQLRQLPFRYYEFTGGILDANNNRFKRLPLIGFEADTRLRKLALVGWNWLNALLATEHRPVRISLHPDDDTLLLRDSLRCLLSRARAVDTCQSVVG